VSTLAADTALRHLRESRDGARIFAPGEVERLAALAGVAVTVLRVDLVEGTVQRVEVAAPQGSDAGVSGARAL
jgi:hypothetical protein